MIREMTQCCCYNDFYTRIPHEFGFRVPPLITTMQAVKAKISLLEALGDIQVAMKIINSKTEQPDLHPLDRQYQSLEVDLGVLDKKSKDFNLLNDYIQSTHATTHSSYKMEVMDIFECQKNMEKERFEDKGNRMLLFHGSRMSNWAGILSQGLRIAPPNAPVTGYMFGKGVYFADMSSKSANYCWPSPSNNIGLLMMCEVSVGESTELLSANYNAQTLAKDSIKGIGSTAPDLKKAKSLEDGTIVPMGPGVNTKKSGSLLYNEYIIYDLAQIKMRYLAKIKFNYGKTKWF